MGKHADPLVECDCLRDYEERGRFHTPAHRAGTPEEHVKMAKMRAAVESLMALEDELEMWD
jgi:hypothetical protein